MRKRFIAGNWKSYKSSADANAWFDTFTTLYQEKNISTEYVTAVLLMPFTLLSLAFERIKNAKLPLSLGSQDVSPFVEGAYTGEINAGQITEFATWTLVGHSERRRDFSESDELLLNKVERAKEKGLKVIYCVQDETVAAPSGVDVIAYEPPWAISAVSGGVAQDQEKANDMCRKIVKKYPGVPVIYGGSTTPDNVLSFVEKDSIFGVLPGGASLVAEKFFSMITQLATK